MEKYDEFKKELTCLLNKHSMENTCDMPDFIMADMITHFLYVCGGSFKKTLDWYGVDSPCHPKK